MSMTLDHLKTNHRVRVLREFTDAHGMPHAPGESGLIVNLELDWVRQEIRIEWERDDLRETMRFALSAGTGPGNGRMRDYFELEEYAPPPRDDKVFIPGVGCLETPSGELPPLSTELIEGDDRVGEAITRVWALAARQRFGHAREQLFAISDQWTQFVAGKLGEAAERHALDPEGAVYEWLRDQAINHWYSWGSQATSGGEGAGRAREIEPAMARFEKLDEYRRSLLEAKTGLSGQ